MVTGLIVSISMLKIWTTGWYNFCYYRVDCYRDLYTMY